MICEFVNPLQEQWWNDWLGEFPDADIFHSAEWSGVLAECYGYSLHHAVFKQDSNVVAMVPIAEIRSRLTGCRAVSLPFSDVCPPLVKESLMFDKAAEQLRAYGLGRRWNYLELRGGQAAGLPGAVQSDEFFVHELDLQDSEAAQFANLKDSHRRNIRKARQSGIEVHTLRSLESVRAYYDLHCMTRRRHGLPPQPFRFFDRIQHNLLQSGKGFVQLARYEGRWIAGAVFLQFGKRATYKFGASDFSFQHLRPNNLLMWDAIRKLASEGFAVLSLGRTDVGDEGLLQFNRGWGAGETRVAYSRIEVCKPVSVSRPGGAASVLAKNLVRRLPVSVLRLIGAAAYRHVA